MIARPVRAQTPRLDFDDLPVYRPLIGGLRHLSRLSSTPPEGAVVELLCGDIHQVNRRAQAAHIYDCHACAEVYLEEKSLPLPRSSPGSRATPAPRRRRPYVDGLLGRTKP